MHSSRINAFSLVTFMLPAAGYANAQSTPVDRWTGRYEPAPPPPPPDPIAHGWDSWRSVLALNVGLGSAVGYFGFTYALSPVPFTSREVGIGTGITGKQYSLMQKLALGGSASTVRFISGVGISRATGSNRAPDPSLWLNLDVAGLEVRTARHFVFFLSAGYTIGLTGGKFNDQLITEDDCSPYPDCTYPSKVPGYRSPQFRMGFGGWF